jgi:hypothetical protein
MLLLLTLRHHLANNVLAFVQIAQNSFIIRFQNFHVPALIGKVDNDLHLLSKYLLMLDERCFDCLVANEVDEAHIVETCLVVDPQEPEVDRFHMLANGVVSSVEQLFQQVFILVWQADLVFQVSFPEVNLACVES